MRTMQRRAARWGDAVIVILFGAGLLLCVATPRWTGAQESQTDTIIDETGIVASDAKLELSSSGYKFTEGPASDAQGNVYFTDQPNDRIMRWDAATGETTEWMKPAGRSNGMVFDTAGNLWGCADGKNELWRISPDGNKIEVMLTGLGEGKNQKLFNGPNDVWCRPDRSGYYFTDPYYRRDYWERGDRMEMESPEIVYYLSAGASQPLVADADLTKPNGIVGTADGKKLYVADIGEGRTYQYRIEADGTLAERTLFCEMGSDGMTIDEAGNVYLTGPGVVVFSPEGKKIAHIPVSDEGWTANVCFGGRDFRTLFITACRGAYTLHMNVAGQRPDKEFFDIPESSTVREQDDESPLTE